MYTKTLGIVLRETEYGERDKILTVLTRERGKMTLRASGVRSSRSTLKGACQLLTYSEFTLFENRGRYTVREAVPLQMFEGLRRDLELLTLGSYFAQVTETVAQENDPAGGLLSLLLNCLYGLEHLGLPQELVKAVFELRLCCEAGFLPDLTACAVCGREECDRFNVTQGVLQCSGCTSPELSGIRMPLPPGTLGAMRYIVSAHPRRLFSFRLSPPALKALGDLTEAYLSMRLERGFFTLDLYKQLFI